MATRLLFPALPFVLLAALLTAFSPDASAAAKKPKRPPAEPAAPAQEAPAVSETEGQSIEFANGLFQRGYYDIAATEYRKYVEKNPQGPDIKDALSRLAECEYALRQYDAAMKALDSYLAVADDGLHKQRALLRKGELLFRLNRPDEAVPVLEALTANDAPGEVRASALYYLGKLEYARGNHAAALKWLKTLADEAPSSPLAPYTHYQLAIVYVALGELENAAIQFSEMADSDSPDAKLRAESRFRAAETYDKIRWFEPAAAAYQQLLTGFPDSEYAQRAAYGYAWALFQAGKYADAATASAAFVEKYPGSHQQVGMTYLKGNCLQQQKDYAGAIAVYRDIREKHPDSEFAKRAQYKTAWALYLSGKAEEAKKEVSDFLSKDHGPATTGDAAFLRGTILASENNAEEAYQEFRLVAEKYGESEFAPEALYKVGECLAFLGRQDEAVKVFESFVQKYPDNILAEEAKLRVGDAQFFSASFDEAVKRYQELLASAPDPSVQHETLYRLAITFHNKQDYKSSADTFRKILDKFPSGSHTAEAHLRIGDFLLREGKDPLKAVEEYDAAFAADQAGPFAGRALKGVALARYDAKDHDGAAAMFVRVMTEFPTVSLNEDTYAWVGQRFFDQEKWKAAATALDALLRAVPDYATPERVRLLIAECSERAGDPAAALKLYRAVADQAPKSAAAVEARFRMAKIHEARKEEDKAVALYEEAANANTGDTPARARFRLGEIYDARKDYEAAAKSYLRVAFLFLHEELSPEALWRAGQCYEKAGGTDQAKRAYHDVVNEYPQCEQAARAKDRLSALEASG